MKPEPLTADQIQKIVQSAIRSAVDYIESDIEPDRKKARRYMQGKVDVPHEKGRSRVVSTKVRDVVRTLKPALARVFFQSETPVEFVPSGPDDVDGAEQATKYGAYKFAACNGYRILLGAFDDTLVEKTGIVKVYFDETEDVDFEEYTGLTDEEFAYVAGADDIEILEHSEKRGSVETEAGVLPVQLHDVKCTRTKKTGKIVIEPVPPDEFFVDDAATSCEDFYIIGHKSMLRVGDVAAMGFDFEEVASLAGDDPDDEDSRWSDDSGNVDRSMRNVMIAEAYMRMDIEGVGIPRLYRFICGGANYKVLDWELADEVPFACFECDPAPHSFFGNSIADLIINDQDTATSLLRGLIDNVAMVNTPRTHYRQGDVSVDDLLNNEVGGLVACKDPQTDTREVVVPPTAGAVLPAMQYFDEIVDAKTGVSRAGMGLDPDALQSTTAAGVNAAVQAASAAAELIARNLAEGGMSRVFKLIALLARKHVEPGEMMQVNGKFVPVDPRAWNMDMQVGTNVGLGTGAREDRLAALREHHAWQLQVWAQYGPDNGLVRMVQIRETRAEILRLSGIHNVEKHLLPMDDQTEQQIKQMAAQKQAQQQPGDNGSQAYMAVEGQKISARVQTDREKMMLDAQEARMKDDRERDKMEQDAILEAVKVGVDPAYIRQIQAQPRG